MLHCADIQLPRNRSDRFFLRIHNAVSIMIFLAAIYFFVKWLSRIHKGKSGRKNVTSVMWLQEDFVLSVFTKYLIDATCDHVKNPQHGNCDQQISDATGQVGDPVGTALWTENLQFSCQKCRKNLQYSCQKCRKICNVRAKNAEKFAKMAWMVLKKREDKLY